MRVHIGVSPVVAPMRRYRWIERISQRDAAKRLGTIKNNWARWERGDVWPDPAWRERILALVEGRANPAAARGPFAVACRHFREREGVTQTEAAELIGVHLRTWRRWECGEAVPSKHAHEFWRLLNRPAIELRAQKVGAA